jgi:hypothetical protein
MRSGNFKVGLVLLLLGLTAVALVAAPAGAAEPTVVELPASTHATSLAAGADGTVWFSL